MLRGSALAKVDEKGRLKLPASFRAALVPRFGQEFFVTSLRGDCARIYPLEVFADYETRVLTTSSVRPLVTRLKNALNYFGQAAVMDAQGRILIHPLLREKARLDGEVTVIGQQNYLEVWNRGEFESRLLAQPLQDEELEQLAQLGF